MNCINHSENVQALTFNFCENVRSFSRFRVDCVLMKGFMQRVFRSMNNSCNHQFVDSLILTDEQVKLNNKEHKYFVCPSVILRYREFFPTEVFSNTF